MIQRNNYEAKSYAQILSNPWEKKPSSLLVFQLLQALENEI